MTRTEPNFPTEFLCGLLQDAITNNDDERIKKLEGLLLKVCGMKKCDFLNKVTEKVVAKECDHNLEILLAARNGEAEKVKMLMDAGVDINYIQEVECDYDGFPFTIYQSPITSAIDNNHIGVIEVIIGSEANMKKYGRMIMNEAVSKDKKEIVQLLKDRGYNDSL